MKKRKSIILIGIFAFLVILCFVIISCNSGKTANIYLDGVLVEKIDLSKVSQERIIQIGKHNTVVVRKDSICMYDADCPDKLCIKQGEISNGAYPIVCLPNKVVIRIEDK